MLKILTQVYDSCCRHYVISLVMPCTLMRNTWRTIVTGKYLLNCGTYWHITPDDHSSIIDFRENITSMKRSDNINTTISIISHQKRNLSLKLVSYNNFARNTINDTGEQSCVTITNSCKFKLEIRNLFQLFSTLKVNEKSEKLAKFLPFLTKENEWHK